MSWHSRAQSPQVKPVGGGSSLTALSDGCELQSLALTLSWWQVDPPARLVAMKGTNTSSVTNQDLSAAQRLPWAAAKVAFEALECSG